MRRFSFVMSCATWFAGCGVAATLASGAGCSSAEATANVSDASVEAEAGADAEPDASTAAAVVPRGSRVLGVGVGIGDLDFQNDVRLVHDAGARTTNLTLAWNEIEHTDPDAGDASPPTYLFAAKLHVANLVLPDEGIAATVTVDALDSGGSRAPGELRRVRFHDVELASRYGRVTDYVVDQLPDTTITALFVASGVDVPFGTDAEARCVRVLREANGQPRARRQGEREGRLRRQRRWRDRGEGAARRSVGSLGRHRDHLRPDHAAAQVRPTSEVASDLEALLAALPAGKPVVIREAAYPSAAECGSDGAKQAAFVRAIFGRGTATPIASP